MFKIFSMENNILTYLFRKELETFINQISLEDFAINFLQVNNLHLKLSEKEINFFLESVQELNIQINNQDDFFKKLEINLALSNNNLESVKNRGFTESI